VHGEANVVRVRAISIASATSAIQLAGIRTHHAAADPR
jgi:hypothetical protein